MTGNNEVINGVIYKTTNILDGKWYIGKDERNNPHYLGSGVYLNRAIAKYGKHNFVKEILAESKIKEELANLEIEYIQRYNAVDNPMSYNIASGGFGGNTIAGMNKEDRIKFSDSMKNSWNTMTIEARKDRTSTMSESIKNKPKSKAHKDKISKSKTGVKQNKETIEKKKIISKDLYDRGIICPPKNDWTGKTHTEESKLKISKSKSGVKNLLKRRFTVDEQLKMKSLKENGTKTGKIAEMFNTTGPTVLRYIREIT